MTDVSRTGIDAPSKVVQFRRVASLLRHLPREAKWPALERMLESRASREERVARAFASSPTPERLVFVCHGNIMRSAFAVAWLQARAPEHASRIIGAGTFAKEGREAEATAAVVAAKMGINLDAHRAVPYLSRGATPSDIVNCMDRANEANVIAATPSLRSRVFLIGDGQPGVLEMLDPYGLGEAATRDAFERVAQHADRWLSKLVSILPQAGNASG